MSTHFKVTRDPQTKCIYLDPISQPHQYTLIFMHGLGDVGETNLQMFLENPMVPPNCRVVLPTG